MSRQGRRRDRDTTGEADGSEPGAAESVDWRDISSTESRASKAPAGEAGETERTDPSSDGADALEAIDRALDLFTGASDPVGERLETYVTELPQWFRDPETTEVRAVVGDEVVETGGFSGAGATLRAAATTRTGTEVSLAVVDTAVSSESEREPWLATERDLLETVVSLLGREVERWEIDSLKRVSDGVAALDGNLCYTYVNESAEQILGQTGDELRGEHVWDVFPEAADTVAQQRLETALETGTSTAFERYNAEKDQWVEARVYPSDDGVLLFFTDISDSKAAESELEQVLEATPVGIVLLTESGEITRANDRAEELLGLSESDIEGRRYDRPDWNIWDEDGVAIPPEDHPVTHAIQTGETVQGFTHGITLPDGSDRWLSSNVTPIVDASGSLAQVVVALEDITVLKRLEQLTETFHPVEGVLNDAATRQATERQICELLTATRAYQYARVAEYTPGTTPTGAALTIRAENASFDDPASPPVASLDELGPRQAAIETGDIQVVTEAEAELGSETWRTDTLERGFRGGAVVPLDYRNRVYGLLSLYTERDGAFGERELALLSTLGSRIGQVLHTLETERVLHTDTVTELTFRSTDPGSFFVFASEQLGCTIDIRDTVPVSEETFVHYACVRGAPVEDLEALATEADSAVRTRQIRRTSDRPGGDVEIELERQSLAASLVQAGAVIEADTVTDGEAEVVCELPLGRDIDSLVTSLTESFPDTGLVAKREYNRSEGSSAETAGQVLADVYRDELTDRQQQAIRAATHGSFFQSPRGSTATEIADALSLSQSTFSYHLRRAQQTLFEAMLERV